MDHRPKVPRALVFLAALAFLFETLILDWVFAAAVRLAAVIDWAAIRAVLMRVVDRLPVWVALLMFGIPFVVAETGAAFCVYIAATGHIIAGSVGYIVVKTFGFGLVVPIFDLTRAKLLTLPWFAYLYEKLLAFHEFALRLVAPYRAVGRRLVGDLVGRLRALRSRRATGANEEAG